MSLIFCGCGCGKSIIIKPHHKYRGVPKYIRGHNKNRVGTIPWNKGLKATPEARNHQSKSQKGKFGIKSNHWKGGKKLSTARGNAAKKQRGFIPLNNSEADGWVAHHLDWNYVIYIPKELHRLNWHSVVKDINMDIINDKVYDWFIGYYLRKTL